MINPMTTTGRTPALQVPDTSDAADAPHRVGEHPLRWAATAFALAVVFHNGTHAYRGADSVGADLFWVGTAGIFVEVGLVVLVFLGDRRAPLAAAVIGAGLAVAYVAVHALPERAWLSDPLLGSEGGAVTRTAAALLIAAAIALSGVGIAVVRRRGGLVSAATDVDRRRPMREALTHPLVVAMVLGNTVVLVSSFVSLGR